MQLSKWFLLAAILLMVVILGFFLPPVSIILMTAPIILPPLKTAGFDLIEFPLMAPDTFDIDGMDGGEAGAEPG